MTDTRRLPVPVAEIIRALEREAANTDTDCRWLAASELRRMEPGRTLICEVDIDPPSVFMHATPKPDACDHDFQGWRPFPDGNGGEQVCTKCGMGAMAYTLRVGP